MLKFYKILSIVFLTLVIVSCEKQNDANFTLKGKIKGLKKGIVYLQKNGDSTDIVNLDSLQISGQPEFVLQTDLEEPILLYLKLFKNDSEEHFIPFFADKGVTEINTSLKQFNYDAIIKGSKSQDLLNEYSKVISDYNDKDLSIIE